MLENRGSKYEILYNAIKCDICGDIVVSHNKHMFSHCRCENAACDGGYSYLKRSVQYPDMYTDLSVSTLSGGSLIMLNIFSALDTSLYLKQFEQRIGKECPTVQIKYAPAFVPGDIMAYAKFISDTLWDGTDILINTYPCVSYTFDAVVKSVYGHIQDTYGARDILITTENEKSDGKEAYERTVLWNFSRGGRMDKVKIEDGIETVAGPVLHKLHEKDKLGELSYD